MKRMTINIGAAGALITAVAGSATAQTSPNGSAEAQIQSQGEGLSNTAHTADTGAGEVGQRLTREDSASIKQPLDRLDNRIQNRVQNRIRNRIDRNYDPTANATSPFKKAEDQAEDSRRRKPR
jgi:hypothetical protein